MPLDEWSKGIFFGCSCILVQGKREFSVFKYRTNLGKVNSTITAKIQFEIDYFS